MWAVAHCNIREVSSALIDKRDCNHCYMQTIRNETIMINDVPGPVMLLISKLSPPTKPLQSVRITLQQ